MALTNVGFYGTVGESEYARAAALYSVDCVSSSSSWKASPGTGRQVAIDVGKAWARGVLSESDAPILRNLDTPATGTGQWFLIVRRIDWSSRAVTIEALPHTSTSTSTPSSPPLTAPAVGTGDTALQNRAGIRYDHVLGWAWCNAANTTVVTFDLRKQIADNTMPLVVDDLTALAGLEPFATPGVAAVVLEGGAVFRKTSLKFIQITSASFASTTARDTAYAKAGSLYRVSGARARLDGRLFDHVYANPTSGWLSAGGAVPALPSTLVGGSLLGNDSLISFTNVAGVELRGLFTDEFRTYEVLFCRDSASVAADTYARFMIGSSEQTSADFGRRGRQVATSSSGSDFQIDSATSVQIDNGGTSSAARSRVSMEISNPTLTQPTLITAESSTYSSATNGFWMDQSSAYWRSIAVDGLRIFPASGLMSGTVQVLGKSRG